MTKYVIEKGVPRPAGIGLGGKTDMIRQMEIDDSIVVPTSRDAENFRTCANAGGMKVSVRKVDGGFRVWRVK
jgi:hypothetical protein